MKNVVEDVKRVVNVMYREAIFDDTSIADFKAIAIVQSMLFRLAKGYTADEIIEGFKRDLKEIEV